MAHMQKILGGVIVDPLLKELSEHGDLWNRYDMRTKFYADSPHRHVDDLWLRYNDWSNFDPQNPHTFAEKHESVWYAAAHMMPAIKDTIEKIFVLVDGAELGGCLITKIPPGKCVYPHKDLGWHPEYYLSKYLLLLQSAPGQTFEFGDEKHEGEAGEIFIFDNRHEHAVYNNSDVDRISLIMAIRQKCHNSVELNAAIEKRRRRAERNLRLINKL